jgi:L-ribulose-5-phosphate 4-epimerase
MTGVMGKYELSRQQVLEASLWLSEHGYFGSQLGTGGNVSVRIDGEDAMAITPTSARYQELAVDDICVVGFDLASIEAKTERKPSMESGMHSIIYRRRLDINAVVHTHQLFGGVFALINEPIPALFDEVSCALGPTVEVVPYALSGSARLAENVGEKLSNNANAYIIQNHGIIALGRYLREAILHAELLEKVAQAYCLALSTGREVHTLPASVIGLMKKNRNLAVKATLKKARKGK